VFGVNVGGVRTAAHHEIILLGSITFCLLTLAPSPLRAQTAEVLPETKRLEWTEADLSGRLMEGAHQFVERAIAQSVANRTSFWHRDIGSAEAYANSVQPNRDRLKTIIGAVDARLPAKMER